MQLPAAVCNTISGIFNSGSCGNSSAARTELYNPDVKYCGPSNSLEHSFLLAVAPCLNEACFFHDNCYSEHCILSPSISHFNDCIFTTQTAAICDVALLQACKTCSFGAVSDPLFKHSSLVCAIATCLAGEPVCDPNLQPNLPSRIACITKNNNCAAQYTLRSSVSVCNQPAPECRSCNGQSPCGSLEGQDCCASQFCCPCGQTCATALVSVAQERLPAVRTVVMWERPVARALPLMFFRFAVQRAGMLRHNVLCSGCRMLWHDLLCSGTDMSKWNVHRLSPGQTACGKPVALRG